MAESYGIDETTLSGNDLLAGSHPVVMISVVLGAGAGDLAAGQVLAWDSSNDYKYYKWSYGGANELGTPRAVLARDTDASGGADVNTVAFVHGEFRRKALDWNSATDPQITEAKRTLQEFGIFVKEDQV
jgi:hypothetical protein